MLTIRSVLLILSLVLFVLAALNVNSGRVNLIGAGLSLLVLSMLLV